MKKFIPLLLVIFLITGCVQPQPETHQVEIGFFTPYLLFPETLNGQVKEVFEKNYFAVEQDGKLVKSERMTVASRDTFGWTNDFKLLYDESGNLLQSDLIDENDALINRNKQTVEDGKISESQFFKDDTLRRVTKLAYNEEGKLTGLENFRMPIDTLIVKGSFIYDENGNMVEWQIINPLDEMISKYIFTVNQDGKRTGFSFYNKEGKKTFEQKFSYNDHGSLGRQELINANGESLVTEYEYEYDDMGNWTKYTSRTGPTGVIAERAITYYQE